jgi:hypothetical protein
MSTHVKQQWQRVSVVQEIGRELLRCRREGMSPCSKKNSYPPSSVMQRGRFRQALIYAALEFPCYQSVEAKGSKRQPPTSNVGVALRNLFAPHLIPTECRRYLKVDRTTATHQLDQTQEEGTDMSSRARAMRSKMAECLRSQRQPTQGRERRSMCGIRGQPHGGRLLPPGVRRRPPQRGLRHPRHPTPRRPLRHQEMKGAGRGCRREGPVCRLELGQS